MPREQAQAMKLDFGTLLNGVAANAAPASRTVNIDVSRVSSITIVFKLVHSAATAMTVTASRATDGGSIYGIEQSISVAGGVGTLSDFTWSKAVSGNKTISFQIPVGSTSNLQLIFSATGGGAGDLMTVTALGGVG